MKKNNQERDPKNMVNLWERLELRAEKGEAGASFITRIEDIDKEALVIEKPIRIAGELQLETGQKLEVVFNRKDASYTFDAIVMAIDPERDDQTTIQSVSDVRRTQRRRFVRIDIAGMISFKVIDPKASDEKALGLEKKGELLNVSAGGVLLCTDEKMKQADIVLMNFSLKNSQRLENILGVVKRFESSADTGGGCTEYLVGVEFLSKEQAMEMIPAGIAEYLPATANYFNEALEQLVVHFIYKQQVETRKRTTVDS